MDVQGGRSASLNSGKGTYFEPESRLQLVDKLRHFVRFSDFLLLLTGESGVGKSTLLKQLAPFSKDNSIQSCFIAASPDLNASNLLAGLMAQIPNHSEHPDNDQGRLEALNEQIKATRAQGQRLLIMIDDADLLPMPVLDLLINLQFSNENDDGTAPQLLLLGGEQFLDKLRTHGWVDAFAGRLHQLELAPFLPGEMKEYVGLYAPAVATWPEKQQAQLIQRCGGVPGRLDEVIQALQGKGVQSGKAVTRRAFPFPPVHMAGIAVLLVMITAVAAWQFSPDEEPVMTVDDGERVVIPLSIGVSETASSDVTDDLRKRLAEQEERLRKTVPSESLSVIEPKPAPKPASEAVIPDQQGVLAVKVPNSKGSAPAEPVKPALNASAVVEVLGKPEAQKAEVVTEAAQIKPEVKAKPESAVDRISVPLVVDAVRPASHPQPRIEPVAEVITVKDSTALPEPVKTLEVVERSTQAKLLQKAEPAKLEVEPPKRLSSIKPAVTPRITKDEKVLLGLPRGSYALQVLGARELASLERFFRVYPVNNELKSFSTIFKGKPWYVVVYGVYPSRQSAMAAVKGLPKGLQKLRPWARSIKGIQNDIRNK